MTRDDLNLALWIEEAKDYAIFQNMGYQGLYGGLGAKEIHAKKGLKKSQKILDHMGSTELAANLFRATQTDEKIRRENIKGKAKANQTHFEVGAKVRQTIKELGGTMPEDLPTPQKSIKQIEREQKKKELAKKKLSEARASRAKEVENLRKNMIAAQKAYKEALEAFVKDYGTYHFSTSSFDELPHLFDFLCL